MATLDRVFVRGLQAAYDAHLQGAEQAAANRRTAATREVRQMLAEGSRRSRRQARRLGQVFATVGLRPVRLRNEVMAGIRDANVAMAADAPDALARDLGHITSSRLAQHLFAVTYGTLRAYARTLGNPAAARLLGRTLAEVKRADADFSRVAGHLLRPGSGGGVLRAVGVLGMFAGSIALARKIPLRG